MAYTGDSDPSYAKITWEGCLNFSGTIITTTGILGNCEQAYDFIRLIFNWTKELTLFTNGAPTLTSEQTTSLRKHNITVVAKEIR